MDNNENIKTKKKGNGIAVVIILILLAVIVACVIYILNTRSKLDETNKSSSENNSNYNAPQLNRNLKDIEEVAVGSVSTSGKPGTYTISADINNDGNNDEIKVEGVKDESFDWVSYYKLYYDGKLFYDGSIIHYGGTETNTNVPSYLNKVYVVDLDKSDKYLDVVVYGDHASDDFGYSIFTFDGKTFKEKTTDVDVGEALFGEKMYVDGEDIVLVQHGAYVETSPIISDAYYSYKRNAAEHPDKGAAKDELVTFNDVYFTEDLDNIQKSMEDFSNYVSDENIRFDSVLEENGVYKYSTVKAYPTEVDHNNYYVKVKLEDGREGYLFVANGVFAG